ncbi:MAG TPA: adenylate/guanylate cyclase domain-containing protein [Candidatus Limnocylindria bacterium]|nr:adenylate/guanylate cyclase domain-containing protein [Candidatus Limnocylindria bacterium]
MATGPLPRGTLTFLFTDIEGSTKLLNALGTDRYHEVLEVHTETLRGAFAKGHEVRIEGDALFMVFATAQDALAAAAAGQRALGKTKFPHDAVVRVRMGMHTGEGMPASERAGADYVGIDVHRAARIAAIAHGGQVLASGATRMLAGSDLPAGVALRDLGEHRLKDLAHPERIFQLIIDGCPSEFPALRTLDRIPNNLPTQVTTFIGRQKEIRDGLKLLDGTRLLTLTGPGGTGKTRLSLQLAAEAGPGFPDGTFWVPLAPIADPDLVPSTIAHSLGVQVSGNEQPLTRVTEHLRDKTVLLILDNFEQILPAAPTVATLLGAAPRLKVVTSSRAPLRIAGEQELPVPPLDVPDPGRLPSLEVLAQSDAVTLFVERARAVKPDFMVTAENAGAVAEICYRLDGLPLAIELAAARVKVLTPLAMLPRLKQGLDLLASSSPDRADRQRTLRGAIAWSYDLLDSGLQKLFARCAVFVAGATLEQLESVCGPSGEIGRDVIDGVSELVDQSLMRQNDVAGEPRFRMYVTIREFALEKLAASGEHEALRQRHCAAYVAFAERAGPELQGNQQKRWLDLVELEHDNLRAALDHAFATGRIEESSRLVYALWRFWQARSHLLEARVWTDRALAVRGTTPLQRLRILEAAGGVTYWMADEEATRRNYREAHELARSSGSVADKAQAAYNYAFTFFIRRDGLRDDASGDAMLRESLDAFRQIGDRAGVARAAWALGAMHAQGVDRTRDELVSATAYVKESYAAHQELGNRFAQAWDLHTLGLAELKLGEHASAGARWRDALGLLVEANDSSGIVIMLSNFSALAKAAGDLDRHATLVGAETTVLAQTGVELMSTISQEEHRAVAADIGPEHRAALERGLAMKMDDAVAYALQREPAKTA